ncbi:MAG: hypothetical protein RI993_448, partial [Pseudomonadota bacterium]
INAEYYEYIGFFDIYGAGRGNRTPMMSPSRDFESRASTNSAIPAGENSRAIITENPVFSNLFLLCIPV